MHFLCNLCQDVFCKPKRNLTRLAQDGRILQIMTSYFLHISAAKPSLVTQVGRTLILSSVPFRFILKQTNRCKQTLQTNQKQPALTRVEKQMLAMFLQFVTLTFWPKINGFQWFIMEHFYVMFGARFITHLNWCRLVVNWTQKCESLEDEVNKVFFSTPNRINRSFQSWVLQRSTAVVMTIKCTQPHSQKSTKKTKQKN